MKIAIKEAQAVQSDIFTYSPRSGAAKDYESFAKGFDLAFEIGAEVIQLGFLKLLIFVRLVYLIFLIVPF